jgi:hypothetical protein
VGQRGAGGRQETPIFQNIKKPSILGCLSIVSFIFEVMRQLNWLVVKNAYNNNNFFKEKNDPFLAFSLIL